MRLLLAAWRPLPLLILLENLTLGVDDGNDRLAEALPDQCLKFVLDLRLLLLQVVGMKDWRLVLIQLDLLIGDIFRDSRADRSRFELVLEHLLIYGEVGRDIILVPSATLYRHACLQLGASFCEAERKVASVDILGCSALATRRRATSFDT